MHKCIISVHKYIFRTSLYITQKSFPLFCEKVFTNWKVSYIIIIYTKAVNGRKPQQNVYRELRRVKRVLRAQDGFCDNKCVREPMRR